MKIPVCVDPLDRDAYCCETVLHPVFGMKIDEISLMTVVDPQTEFVQDA
jgi:hypothetical protein